MSIRFGIGTGANVNPVDLPAMVDRMEAAGVDSLWFSELVYSPAVDPFVGMAFALSRTSRMKVGTSVAILPGRHPVLVAKQLVSLSLLAPRRVLPVFGLQPAGEGERELFPVRGRRGDAFDESLALLRAALRDDDVDFSGDHFDVHGVTVRQGMSRPLDIWLGGRIHAAYRRIGRYGDGWLGSFITADEAKAGVAAINAEAEAAGRHIDDDHFGITLFLDEGADQADIAARIERQRPGVDPMALIATSWPHLHRLIDAYIDSGISKFVVIPSGATPMSTFVDRFADELVPRQN